MLLPWVLVCLAALIALALCGLSVRYRWAGAITVAGIAVAATGLLLWMDQRPRTLDDAALHLPAVIALIIAVWLAVTEWPARSVPGEPP